MSMKNSTKIGLSPKEIGNFPKLGNRSLPGHLKALCVAFDRVVAVNDEASYYASSTIADQIAMLQSRTLDELKIKARVLIHFFENDVSSVRLEEGCVAAQAVGDSIIRDILAMDGQAGGSAQ